MGFDVVVIGAGHAGCEAALACARMGQSTLLLALNLDALALMPCNPAIGGTAKGHLVRELDALGGEMGLAIDETFLQSRMLNTGKGPAVHSLRAQADKLAYRLRMRRAVDAQERLTLRQGEAAEILIANGSVTGVRTATGERIPCRSVIVCCGVYLQSRIIIGECAWDGGPQGLMRSGPLADSLRALGFPLRRFKTGTPARVDGATIDFSRMTPQPGDDPVVPFSFLSPQDGSGMRNRSVCYLTYTTPETHEILRANLHRSPMVSGAIRGTGARYCPSIEDKVIRFADKSRHPVFLEPEGLYTSEWYVQGMSSSMPEDVQRAMYASVPGLERAELVRLAYAIEYETIDPTCLTPTLEAREIGGLFFAGQVNGTSGYEEAAAQGIFAGINAALRLQEREPLFLTRADAYIGVLVDDLVTRGVDEPYRMMTSRAEYRLLLRQDNADLRLTEAGWRVGLASDERYRRMCEKREASLRMAEHVRGTYLPTRGAVEALLAAHGAAPRQGSVSEAELLRRPEMRFADIAALDPALRDTPVEVAEQTEVSVKYEGYIGRAEADVQRFRREESTALPPDLDYGAVSGLRIEARQKLAAHRPATLGQAARIPGVSPADITVLLIALRARRGTKRLPGASEDRNADGTKGEAPWPPSSMS